MIDSIRTYIATCPYLDELVPLNVDYLPDNAISYSVNEGISYDPVLSRDIIGNEECQYQFTFDAKLYWNDEGTNNIDNSTFFEDFTNWLREQNNNKTFPDIDDIEIHSIRALSNGYIQDTNSEEAIYRISLVMYYWRSK